jgi:hypothetical protein
MLDWAKPRPKSAVTLSGNHQNSSSSSTGKPSLKPKSAGTRFSAIEAADILRASIHPSDLQNDPVGRQRRISSLSGSTNTLPLALGSKPKAAPEKVVEDPAKLIESQMQAVSAAYSRQLAAGRTPGLACISNTANLLVSAADTVFQHLDDLKARKGLPAGSSAPTIPVPVCCPSFAGAAIPCLLRGIRLLMIAVTLCGTADASAPSTTARHPHQFCEISCFR